MEFKDKVKKILEIFEIQEVEELPGKLYEIVENHETKTYNKYKEITGNNTNFIQHIYQYYFSDREEYKQDFTPESISKLLGEIGNNGERVLDLCSGTGSLTLNNISQENILVELNENTISSLLFNMCLHNIQGIIICGDVLTGKYKKIYKLTRDEQYSTCEEKKIQEYELGKYDTVISNPPFNIKYNKDLSLEDITIKKSNMNYAFVFRGLEHLTDNGTLAYILPNSITSSQLEKPYRKYIVDHKLLRGIIQLPGSMFESTSIPIVILILAHDSKDVFFCNIEKCEDKLIRHKRGTGDKSKTERIYKKELNALSDKQIQDIIHGLNTKENKPGTYKTVPFEEVINEDYTITPQRYIDFKEEKDETRSFEAIIDDINKCTADKNKFKITMNLTILKKLEDWTELYEKEGKNNEIIDQFNQVISQAKELQELYKNSNQITDDLNATMFYTDKKLINENWLKTTRSAKNTIQNTDPKELCEVYMQNLSNCMMMIRYLNNRQSEYFMELRDKLIPLLMSGELEVPEELYVDEDDLTDENQDSLISEEDNELSSKSKQTTLV